MGDDITQPENAQRPVILKDVAERCGVHIMTVSRALRGDRRRVSAETIARVTAVAREMGYDPAYAHAARRLVMRRFGQQPLNHVIVMLFPRGFHREPYYFSLFNTMLDVFSAENFGIFTINSDDAEHWTVPPILVRGECDGVVVMGSNPPTDKIFAAIAARGAEGTIPVVSLIEAIPNALSVDADDSAGGYAAAAHLLDLGHRHLLHFHAEHSINGGQRLRGYRQACRDRGLDPEPLLHYCDWFNPYMKDHNGYDWIWADLQRALTSYPQITAILAPNDYYAVRFYTALQMNGLSIPEDLSLVGFDDTHLTLDANKGLTTIHIPLDEIGAEAARLLLRQITSQPVPEKRITLPASLIVRNSTCPPKR